MDREIKDLDQIIAYISTHDTGAITAYRSNLTNEENQARNSRLMAKLMIKNYGVTSIKGTYIENFGSGNATDLSAEILFVVDLKNKSGLRIELENLGQEFDQDSVLLIPKGSNVSYILGTNKAQFPGKGREIITGSRHLSLEGEFLSTIRFRPFIFIEEITEMKPPTNIMGKWAMWLASK